MRRKGTEGGKIRRRLWLWLKTATRHQKGNTQCDGGRDPRLPLIDFASMQRVIKSTPERGKCGTVTIPYSRVFFGRALVGLA